LEFYKLKAVKYVQDSGLLPSASSTFSGIGEPALDCCFRHRGFLSGTATWSVDYVVSAFVNDSHFTAAKAGRGSYPSLRVDGMEYRPLEANDRLSYSP
jgi:hypothetical protein